MRRNGLRSGALRAYLRAVEKEEIEAALGRHRWNVSATARELGVTRIALHRRLQTLGIARPRELIQAEPSAERASWLCPWCGALTGESEASASRRVASKGSGLPGDAGEPEAIAADTREVPV
jgi:hypothetical protein